MSLSTKKIKVSTYINIILGITLVIVVGFGWFYLKGRNPVPAIQNAVTLNDVPKPEYLFSIYGPIGEGMGVVTSTFSDGERIYVAEGLNRRIAVFDYSGNFLQDIGRPDKKKKKQPEGTLQRPFDITKVNDELYVTDTTTRMIHVFNSEGKFLRFFAPKKVLLPSGIEFKNNKIYVIDSSSQAIRVFDLEGNHLLSFGGRGPEEGKLNFPYDIYVNDSGNIYVSDSNNNRIQVFDEKGKITQVWSGKEEDGNGGYSIPRGVALDNKGNLFTAELLSNDVAVAGDDGVVKTRFSYAEPEKEGVVDKMTAPTSVFVDNNQRLYVTDFTHSRVLVYQIKY